MPMDTYAFAPQLSETPTSLARGVPAPLARINTGTIAATAHPQHTLAEAIRCAGVGVHSGRPAHMEIRPAAANRGITFIRTDKSSGSSGLENHIPALWHSVSDTRLCTVLSNAHGIRVSTVEHIMAALAGSHIDNADILIDGEEIPIMDGSAAEFSAMLADAGREEQAGTPRRFIRVLRPVRVAIEDKWVTFEPDTVPSYEMTIDFPSKAIGTQTLTYTPQNTNSFSMTLARARTFGFLHEVEYLQKMGLGRGGSLENAVVIDKDRILNADGLRYDNEFVRHKLLDSVGDLALAGAPFIGAYRAYKGGHALNNSLLRALFASPDNWEWVE